MKYVVVIYYTCYICMKNVLHTEPRHGVRRPKLKSSPIILNFLPYMYSK